MFDCDAVYEVRMIGKFLVREYKPIESYSGYLDLIKVI